MTDKMTAEPLLPAAETTPEFEAAVRQITQRTREEYFSLKQQKILHRALRRSVRIIDNG